MYLFISAHKYRVHVITGDVKDAGTDVRECFHYHTWTIWRLWRKTAVEI